MNDSFHQRQAVPTLTVEAGSRDGGALRDRVQSLRLPQQTPARRGVWLPWLLCAALAASTGYLGFRAATVPPPDEPRDLQAPTAPAPTTTAPAAVAPSGGLALEAKGYLIPAHKIQVSPKVGGMVVKLYIREEGQRFQKGALLAELEKTEYLADSQRAEALLQAARERLRELENGNRPQEIESARAEFAEAEAQREQLYLDWKRNTALKSGSALSQREFEQAQSAYRAMDRRVEKLRQGLQLMVEGPRKERLAVARAEVAQAEAELTKARWRLDNTNVVAPVSGTILTKKAEEGDMVNPSAFSNGLSASLCEMADLSELEVELDVQERDVARVFKGQRCKVRAEAFPDRNYEGTVSRLMPIANRAKGAVPVRVTVQVPKGEEGVYLKPEMGVIVSFLNAER